jgi:uncharacterized protein (TIGR03437 family)
MTVSTGLLRNVLHRTNPGNQGVEMRTHALVRLAGLALLTLLTVPLLFGAEYTFTKITDDAPGSTLGLAIFGGPFLINNNGLVVFTAQKTSTLQNGVYAGSGNGLTTVYEGGLTLDSPRVNWATGVNDSGVIVYEGGGGLYTITAGGQPFLVSPPTGSSVIRPAINNAGTVAFGGSGNNSILTRTGTGPVQTLVSDTELPRGNQLFAPLLNGVSINNSGTAAFYASNVASGTGCSCGLYTKNPSGAATAVSQLQQNISLPFQINDSGAVVFSGTYQGTKGVFIASGGQIAAAVDLSGQTVSLPGFVSMNNQGEVAYIASFLVPSLSGIFTGPDKVADRVIATGDPLFGSIVSDIVTPQVAGRFLNDKGQVVFAYRLSNGLSGVAVATPMASNAQLPKIATGGILNGASFSGDAPVAPGEIVSIFGDNFATKLAGPPPTPGPLPTSLEGVSVTFNGAKAPLFFIAPGQINAEVPFEVTGTSAVVQVTTPAGVSNTQNITIAPASPAIFTAAANGVGQGVIVFANTVTIVGPVQPGTDWRPAKAGDTITVYATGLGAVTPPINDGWNSCDLSICKPDFSNLTLRNTTVRPKVKIGNVNVPDNMVLFSGFAPAFAGLYQLNITIPDGVTPGGSVPVVIQMGNVSSPQNLTIAMQ